MRFYTERKKNIENVVNVHEVCVALVNIQGPHCGKLHWSVLFDHIS